MRKNVAGQVVGAQMVSATDGSAFSGNVSVYVTGDGGSQALGSGSSPAGIANHEGNGFYTYVPTQAETNYDHVAYTFIASGAIPVTVQTWTRILTVAQETKLAAGADGLVPGTVASGASTTSIPTNLTPNDTDQYNGRTITFTSGPLNGESSDITATTTGGVLTVTALTRAPDQGVTFVIS